MKVGEKQLAECVEHLNELIKSDDKKLAEYYLWGLYGFHNICTLNALRNTNLQIDNPDAEQALEEFRFQILLNIVKISPMLHKHCPLDYTDKAHIAELAEMCEKSLRQKKLLSFFNEKSKMTLLSAMDETPLREYLLTENMNVRKNLFVQELGL